MSGLIHQAEAYFHNKNSHSIFFFMEEILIFIKTHEVVTCHENTKSISIENCKQMVSIVPSG